MRELVAAFNRGELASTVEVLDEHVVWDARDCPVPDLHTVYHGRAGVTDFWMEWLPMWERIESEILWIEGVGDRVVMWLRQEHVGRGGASASTDYGWDVIFRNGQIIRVNFFSGEAKARAALAT